MILAKQSAAFGPRSNGAGRANFGLNLVRLRDTLITTSAVLVRHSYCAPLSDMATSDRGDQ